MDNNYIYYSIYVIIFNIYNKFLLKISRIILELIYRKYNFLLLEK